MVGVRICIINMIINIRSEYTDSNKYVLYKIESGKKIKICKGIFNDSECIHVNETLKTNKLVMIVYPKYYSKFKWFFVWLLLSIVELYATCFGSFASNSKMYKEFTIVVDESLKELNLVFNKSRYDLTSSTEGVLISEKIKGRLYTILISIFGLAFIILLIFCIVFIQIYLERK